MITNNPHIPEVEEAHILDENKPEVAEVLEHKVCNGCFERSLLLKRALRQIETMEELVIDAQRLADEAIANCESMIEKLGGGNADRG
jgi:hypothetical protein